MTSPTTVIRKPGELTFRRRFPTPREMVFRALSDADLLRQWWGPPNFPVDECTVDFRPGGVWHYCMRGMDGSETWARSVYREIVPPERVSYLERSSDAHAAVTDERPGAFVTITLNPDEGGTTLTARVRHLTPLDGARAIGYGVERGLSSALDLLENLLDRIAPCPHPSSIDLAPTD